MKTAFVSPIRRAGGVAIGAALLVSMALSSLVSAQDATPMPFTPSTDPGSLSGKVEADGSSTVGPITEAVAEEFGKVAKGVEVKVDISGTGGGFKRFCAGETDIQDASRQAKPEEAAICAAAGIDYWSFEVAYDGITVVVNKDNDWATCLTVAQLNQLWGKDATATKWSDIDPSWPGDPISLYGPGTDSGTFDYFTEKINGTQGESTTNYTPSEDDNVLVQGVAGDKNALGYFGFAYYEQNQDTLTAVQIDGGNGCVAPSTDTIRDLSYSPLSRPLFVYVKKESLARPEIQEFLRFYLANAQSLVADVGYVDSPIDVIVGDQTKLEGAIAGTTPPDGPGAVATPTS